MRIVLAALASLALVHAGQSPLSPSFTDPGTDALRLSYGPDPEQYGELRLPSGDGPFPVAIVLHGGCFLAKMATARHTAAFADALRRDGFATWNVEYRRIGSAGGGGWPETYRDIGRAADHVRILAREYPLDTTRTIAVGHSAGGFLALWLGGRHSLPRTSDLYAEQPLPLHAVVALGADGDLLPIAGVLEKACQVPVVSHLLGEDAATRAVRALQANPADMPPFPVRQVLVSGDKDPFETPALRDAYAARARAKGETIEVATIPGAGHFEVIDPDAQSWSAVRHTIVSLLPQPR